MTRHSATVLLSVLLLAGCGTGVGGGGSGGSPSAGTPSGGTPGAALAKLAPPLAARLPGLPPDAPVRLVATLEPGTPTERITAQLEPLGGRLVQRFTLIEAATVQVPARGVLPLAELSWVRGLELDETGVPPPS